MTQSEILALIDEIQTAADYPATKMNPLLKKILAAAYGPMYIGYLPPSNTTDENVGYRPGSVGFNTQTQRYYICQSATAGNAVWVLIPADSNFYIVVFTSSNQNITIGTDTSVIKVTSPTYDACSILLPADPYIGKTVVVYFDNAQTLFSFKDSLDVLVNGGDSLAIPAGQQYTFTYSGTAWEIVGVNNTTAGSLSGVDIADTGGVVTTDTNKLTFLGTGATVADDGSGGTNITINPLAGIDVKEGATTVKSAAQFVSFAASNFDVTVDGTGASVAFNQRIGVKKDSTNVSTQATGFDFIGPLYDSVSMNGTIAEVTLNGAKTWTGNANLFPGITDDASSGYSKGSIGYNTGNLLRTYVCTDNTTGAAQWRRLTEDNGYVALVPVNNTTAQIDFYVSNVVLTSGSRVGTYTLLAPQYAYLGKRVFIYSNRDIDTAFYYNSTAGVQFSGTITAGTSIIMVCTNESTQTWTRIG